MIHELWCSFVVNLQWLLNKQLNCQWFKMPWCSCDITAKSTSHFNIKMSYQYSKSHCGVKNFLQPFALNGIPCNCKTAPLYSILSSGQQSSVTQYLSRHLSGSDENDAPLSMQIITIHINRFLTHLPLDKMAAILQATFLNAFAWMTILESWSNLYWNLFLRVQLTINQHWFR